MSGLTSGYRAPKFMVLSLSFNFVSSELANEDLGMALIDRSHSSTRNCFRGFAHAAPHQRFPSSFAFAFVDNRISSFKAQSSASQKFLFIATHTHFSFLRKMLAATLHTTEFSPRLHIPPVSCVPERQHGAVKRAYTLGPEPIVSLLCKAEGLYRAEQASLFPHLSSCVVCHSALNYHFPQTATEGQWATSSFLEQR